MNKSWPRLRRVAWAALVGVPVAACLALVICAQRPEWLPASVGYALQSSSMFRNERFISRALDDVMLERPEALRSEHLAEVFRHAVMQTRDEVRISQFLSGLYILLESGNPAADRSLACIATEHRSEKVRYRAAMFRAIRSRTLDEP